MASSETKPHTAPAYRSAGLDILKFIAEHQSVIRQYAPPSDHANNLVLTAAFNGTEKREGRLSYSEVVVRSLQQQIDALTPQQVLNMELGVRDLGGDGKVLSKGFAETDSATSNNEASEFFDESAPVAHTVAHTAAHTVRISSAPAVSPETVTARLKLFAGSYLITSTIKAKYDKSYLDILPKTNQAFFYAYNFRTASLQPEPTLAAICAGDDPDNDQSFKVTGFDKGNTNAFLNLRFVISIADDCSPTKITFDSDASADTNAIKGVSGVGTPLPRTTALEYFPGVYQFTPAKFSGYGFSVSPTADVEWGKIASGNLVSDGAVKVAVSINGRSVSWVSPDGMNVLTGVFARTWDDANKVSPATFKGNADPGDAEFTANLVVASDDDGLNASQRFFSDWRGVVLSFGLSFLGLNVLGILGTVLTIKYHRSDLAQLKKDLAEAEQRRKADLDRDLLETSHDQRERDNLKEDTDRSLEDIARTYEANLDAENRRDANNLRTREAKMDDALVNTRADVLNKMTTGDPVGYSNEQQAARTRYRLARINDELLKTQAKIREKNFQKNSSLPWYKRWFGRDRDADPAPPNDLSESLSEVEMENFAAHDGDGEEADRMELVEEEEEEEEEEREEKETEREEREKEREKEEEEREENEEEREENEEEREENEEEREENEEEREEKDAAEEGRDGRHEGREGREGREGHGEGGHGRAEGRHRGGEGRHVEHGV